MHVKVEDLKIGVKIIAVIGCSQFPAYVCQVKQGKVMVSKQKGDTLPTMSQSFYSSDFEDLRNRVELA